MRYSWWIGPSLSTPMSFAQLVAAARCLLLHIQWPPEGRPGWYWVQWTWTLWLTMWWLKKWWSDTRWLGFFCLNSHIVGITDGATRKCFDTSTHMLKSKSRETHWVRFSSTDTFYPPAAYSPPNRNTFSNRFKALLFDALWLKILSNHAFVSMACKFDSNTNRFLTNYSSFTSINKNQLNTTNDFDFSLGALGPRVAEDIYAATVTEDIDMTDVSPSLMITGRLYFPLPTHLKWTSGISSCLPRAHHWLDRSTEQQLQMSRRISTFFGWSQLVPWQDPLWIGMCFSWTCPLMRYLFSTNDP